MAKKQNIKVIIGVPCSDSASMKAKTAHAIGAMIIKSKGLVVDFLLRQSADIVSNRAHLVAQAIAKGGTHLLFIDSDMWFPPETLQQLLAHKKEVVGARYNKRQFPLTDVSKPLTEVSDTELYKAAHLGLGVTLIDLSIFTGENPLGGKSEKYPEGVPWFMFGREIEGGLMTGEDVWFCSVVRDSGRDVWIDPTLKVRHCGEYMY